MTSRNKFCYKALVMQNSLCRHHMTGFNSRRLHMNIGSSMDIIASTFPVCNLLFIFYGFCIYSCNIAIFVPLRAWGINKKTAGIYCFQLFIITTYNIYQSKYIISPLISSSTYSTPSEYLGWNLLFVGEPGLKNRMSSITSLCGTWLCPYTIQSRSSFKNSA